MVSIRGVAFRLYPRATFFKLIWYGLIFLTLSFVLLMFTIDSSPTINYPYNMYKGYPLTIYDNPYNINKTECKNFKVVIVVHSAVTNFNKRDVIRKTWGNKALLRRYGTKLVFFLGMPLKKDLQILINEESVKNDDMVQGHFLDSYTNITHKAVLWLRWINENCPSVQTVLKLDDDVFVNVFSFHHHLPLFEIESRLNRHIWCEVVPVGTQRIQRKTGLKWRVAEHELMGLTHYPLTLCRGYFVVMTIESVRTMYEAAKETPFFWIDDFYIFGTLANKTGARFSSLQFLAEEKDAFSCFTSTKSICQIMGVLLDSNDVMETFWKYTIQQLNSIS
ncbi:beta-1,3-galactosyltransferase 9-like [Mercenaria mercenaria]|uniref:beta-1,3-galactosyltransferase 9-like n=1 Tax=Mercenaria mercenaria TaxID=6596 RepID=UPI00234E9B31|nr:beta-1,3-galactosyltransferase 9-like [Mercenaria mercenaria]XP_053387246.1 beta-1,3-galactosyltransferase 9-like [Mercenaria mercenaria]XP_053387254.1 beta-1,3-galactosyltransferase 9-like [Mercenaria mercenaria]XP_053387259.1 beta-1,3-galactosyltransferase 9-like [Mercenaria mercenaria]XP_053387262.1 beta-1,3-galactosyltransferase 9-like [Mercenaria mercenaria]